MDAIILAGDKGERYGDLGVNKSLIRIKNEYVINYMIYALSNSKRIKDIYVVGPKVKLDKVININLQNVTVFEQQEDIVSNILYVKNVAKIKDGNLTLILGCDIPLVSTQEVEYFIGEAKKTEGDWILGFSDCFSINELLKPLPNRIKRPSFFYFDKFVGRQNNLHCVVIDRISNQDKILKVFKSRHLRSIKNYFQLHLDVFKSKKNILQFYKIGLLSQFTLRLDLFGFEKFALRIGKYIKITEIEDALSSSISAKLKFICIPYATSVLDIDTPNDLRIVESLIERSTQTEV